MSFSGLLLPSTMNNDASSRQNSDEISTNSYKCSFCKRSFSNAQALGGHMNIHRKDRAKLREFSDENLLSLDITKTVNLDSPADLLQMKKTTPNSFDQLQVVVPKISQHNSVRSLLLFAEKPLICDHEKNSEKDKMEMIHGEVDLELRLGHEP